MEVILSDGFDFPDTAIIDGANVARYRGKDRTDIRNIKRIKDKLEKMDFLTELVIDRSLWQDIKGNPHKQNELKSYLGPSGQQDDYADPILKRRAKGDSSVFIVSRDALEGDDPVPREQLLKYYISDFRELLYRGDLIPGSESRTAPIVLWPLQSSSEIIESMNNAYRPEFSGWELRPVWLHNFDIDGEYRWSEQEKVAEIQENGIVLFDEVSNKAYIVDSNNPNSEHFDSCLIDSHSVASTQGDAYEFDVFPKAAPTAGTYYVEQKIKKRLASKRPYRAKKLYGNKWIPRDLTLNPEKNICLLKGHLYYVPLLKVKYETAEGPKGVLINGIPEAIPDFEIPVHLRPPAPESPKSPSTRVPMSLRIRRLLGR